MGAFQLRALFVFASAILAATLIDPLLETLSNAGVFGAGHFTDGSTADVVPALVVASLLAVSFIILSARSQWVRASIGHLQPANVRRLLPAVAVTQFAALFVMETLEQHLVVGHTFGGFVWLGAPVLIAVLAHVIGGALLALVLSRALQAMAAHVVCAVRRILGAFASRRPLGSARCKRPIAASLIRVIEPVLRRVAGRAPPRPSFA